MAAPPDLSKCHRCGRPVPPANRPEFAGWLVAKGPDRKILGMCCPNCQQAQESEAS